MDQTKDLFNDNKIPHKIINKCEKLIIYKKKTNTSNSESDRINFDFKFTFNEPILNVVSVKLLKATLNIDLAHSITTGTADTANGTNGSDLTAFHYYILNINELNNIIGDNSNSLELDSSNSGEINKLNSSFATLSIDNNFDNDTSGSLTNYAHYYNTYTNNKNINYFDPPLNQLKEFNIKLYPHNYNHIENRSNSSYLLLEFLIETKDKMTIYIDNNFKV
jgi:hypothetical protein